MSEIRSESLTADISQPESVSIENTDSTLSDDDAFNTNNNNKIDVNSNKPFDLNSSSISIQKTTRKLYDDDEEGDNDLFEEGDDSSSNSVIDDGTCSRSRPYVRGQSKTDHELFLNRSLLLSSSSSSSSRSVSEKAKESVAVLNKLVLMPTPPEDTDLPALLPKHATPSDPPAEKCDVEVVPLTESPDSFEEPTPPNKSPPPLSSSVPPVPLQNPVGIGNAIRSESPPSKNQKEREEDDSRNFPGQNEKTFCSSTEEKESKTNTSVSPECPDKPVTSDKTPIVVPPTITTHTNTNNTSTSAPSSVTVSIYPTSRKGSNIPVGIAVAWQRLVTSTSSSSSTISSAPTTKMSNAGGTPVVQKEAMKVHPEPPPSPVKPPLRPSSASPVGRLKSNKSPSISKDERGKVHSKSYSDKKPISHHHPFKVEGIGKSLTPDLSSSPPFPLARPMPSSSVPPNLGLPYLHNSPSSVMDSYYGGMRSVTPFPSVNNQHHHHLPHFPSWPSTPGTDLSSSLPQAFIGNSPYLHSSSQHSMQNQMQLHHHHQMTHHHSSSYTNYYSSSASSYMHSGLDVFRHHYEQVLLHSQQQQQIEFLRQYQQHHHQQQQQQQQQLLLSPNGSSTDSQLRVTPGRSTSSIPPTTISPGSTRNPNAPAFLNPSSQLHNHMSLSNLSSTTGTAGTGAGGHHPNWPLESYHHNSSTTLSPKSLTSSSTPSPSEFGSRKCPSPYPHNKTNPLHSTPSTSPHIRDHRDASAKREHMSMSRDNCYDDRLYEKHPPNNIDNHHVQQHFPLPSSSPSSAFPNGSRPTAPINDRIRRDVLSSPSPSSTCGSPSPSVHKHDFTRMENLIEKESNQTVKSDDNQRVPPPQVPIIPHYNVSPRVQQQRGVNSFKTHDKKADKLLVNPSNFSDVSNVKAEARLIETAPTKGTNLKDISPTAKVTDSSKKKVEKAVAVINLTDDRVSSNDDNINPNKKRQRKSDFPQRNNNKKVSPGDETKSAKKKQVKGDERKKSSSSSKRENYKETKVPEIQLPVAALSSPGVTKGRHLHKKALPSESDRTPETVALLSPTKDYSSSPIKNDSTTFTPELKCSNSTSNSNTDNPNNNNNNLLSLRNHFSSDLATNDNSKNRATTFKPENNNSLIKPIYATTQTTKKAGGDATTATTNIMNPSSVMIISNKSQIISPNSVISPGESKLLSPPISSTILNSPVTLILPRIADSTIVSPKIPTLTSLPPTSTVTTLLRTSTNSCFPSSSTPQNNKEPSKSSTNTQQLVEHGTTLQNVNLVASSLIVSSPQVSSSSIISNVNATPCDSETTNPTSKNPMTKLSIITRESEFTSSSSPSRPYLIGSGSLSSSPSAMGKINLPNVCTEIRRASWGGSAHNSICVQKEFREDNHLDLLATVAQEFGSRDDLGKLVGSCGGGGSNFLSPSSSSIASGSSRGSSLMPSPIHSSMQSPERVAPVLLSTISYSTGSNNVSNNVNNNNYSKSEPSSSLPTSPVPMNRLPPTLNPECSQYKDRSNKMNHNHQQNSKKSLSVSTQNGAHTKPHVWLKIPHIIPKAAAKVAEKLLKKKQEKKKKCDEIKTTSSPRDETRDLSEHHMNSLPSPCNNNNINNSSKVDSLNITKDLLKNSTTKERTKSLSTGNLIPKLKIPKISQSFVLQATKRVGNESKEKAKKVSSKTRTEESNNKSNHHSKSNVVHSKGMKMRLPVPKVAKLRIKLSETENPILMKESQSDDLKPKKLKIKRRHSDGDKLSHKKKQHSTTILVTRDIPSDHPTSSSLPKEKATKKRKHTHDSFIYGNETSCKKKSHKKATKIKILSPSSDLSQSFTSLTPPPTAKLLKESPPLNNNSQQETESKTQLQTNTNNNDFSRFHLKHELGETSTSEAENELGESDTNWVSDPTFAASAIRLTPTLTASTTSCNNNQTLIGVKQEGHSYGSAPINTFTTNGKETRETSKDSKPKLSSLSFRHHSLDTKKKAFNDDDTSSDSSSSDEEEEAFHFPSKRVKAATAPSSGTGNRVKPCLKAQPIVRTVSSRSSSSDDSDEDIDLEVAALTNSISQKPFRSPYNNNNKSTFVSKYSNGGHSSTEKANSNGTLIRPSYVNNNTQKHDSSSSSLNIINRRISTNSDTLRSDEELLDIPEDFPLPILKTKSQPIKIRRYSQSSEYDDKSKRLPVKTTLKETHRSSSLSSSPIPNNNNNTNKAKHPHNNNTKSPRKRSSRSSTTSSSTHPTIISSSSSPVSNNKSSSGAAVSSSSTSAGESLQKTKKAKADVEDETLIPGNIQLESVSELLDEMRILTEIQGLFYTGKLNALQPPDVYGVTLDNERGAPPHLIFSAEEVLEKCIREKKPQSLTVGLRICAYWSPQYSGLYPGRVSTDFNPSFDPEKDLIPIEFDDGDTGMIKLAEIRLLPKEHPIREYDPNPLLTLEKKHRKRRHSSANTNSGRCTGDHEEADCGESFCAKVAKYEEEEDEEDDDEFKDNKPRSFKSMYWTWTGLGYKRPKSKKDRNKEFFRGIQRGDEIINVGDSAIFISHGNERPYIGRVEKFWEKKGQKVVTVRWFYHPEEVKSPKRIPHLKHPGALFESPHIDENDVQTIGRKCDVLPFPEFKERIGKMPKLSLKNSNTTKPKDLYYVAGYYDPYTYNLQLKI